MAQSGGAGRQRRAPRGRVCPLIAALRRINATLEPDTVPGEVAASARALTGARYGVIVSVDEEGAPGAR